MSASAGNSAPQAVGKYRKKLDITVEVDATKESSEAEDADS